MFAKFLNENMVEIAPNKITLGDMNIVNPTAEQYAELGYLEVINEIPEESPRKWYFYKKKYELMDTYIRGYYVEEKEECPNYSEEVSKRIRQVYSQSDVEAIILNGNDTEEHAKDLADLQSYRAKVKADVKADIAEWEEA